MANPGQAQTIQLLLVTTSCLLMLSMILMFCLHIKNNRNAGTDSIAMIIFSNANTGALASRKYLKSSPKKREFWIAPGRTDEWWVNMYTGKMLARDWMKNFRMPKDKFDQLANELKPYISPDPLSPRPGLPAEKKLAITLYHLKDKGSIVLTANTFGVSVPTVSQTIKSVCHAINKHLGPRYLKIPKGDELQQSVTCFLEKFGFPQVLGCVDGSHIEIEKPTENSQSYFSYKMMYSLNVQAVCDSTGRFLDVDIQWPGGTHDAKVFAYSNINKGMQEGRIPKLYRSLLPGRDKVPLVLIGDPAYPLLPHCMKEYSTCYNNEQVIFNEMLRSVRNQIECAFGRLKARWQVLSKCMNYKLDDTPAMIYSCFILHNYCEVNNVGIDEAALRSMMGNNTEDRVAGDRRYTTSTIQGQRTQEVITDYFKEYLG